MTIGVLKKFGPTDARRHTQLPGRGLSRGWHTIQSFKADSLRDHPPIFYCYSKTGKYKKIAPIATSGRRSPRTGTMAKNAAASISHRRRPTDQVRVKCQQNRSTVSKSPVFVEPRRPGRRIASPPSRCLAWRARGLVFRNINRTGERIVRSSDCGNE